MKNDIVDWSERSLQRWLGGITRESTKRVYKCAFRLYAQHTGLTAIQLIDEALQDQRSDPREKNDIVQHRLIDFYNWMVKDIPKKDSRGIEVGKGRSSKMAHTYVNAIRSFYGTYEVFVRLKGRSGLPKPRVTNKRMILTNIDVKKLIDHTKSPRDRAIILTLFQGGMDVSTLCSLKYKDVAEGLARDDHPLCLNLYRPKTGTEYVTFLGRDAADALMAYLNDLKRSGLNLSGDTPLFIKIIFNRKAKDQKGNVKVVKVVEGIEPYNVQNMLKELAIKAGFVDENLNGQDFNPLSPHALRESFSSIMINKGIPDTIVDFWLGHEIGEMAEAYKRVRLEELKKLYLEKEAFISVSTGGELEEKLRAEIDDKNRQLQTLVTGLATENVELKQHLKKVEETGNEMKERIERFEAFTKRFMKRTPEEWERLYNWLWDTHTQSIEKGEKGAPMSVQLEVLGLSEEDFKI